MKHYPHHIGDFNNATRHLSRVERSLYRDLIELYYELESPLPLDVPELSRKILANECSTDVERMLNEFFVKTPIGWFHSRCETELDKYKSNSSQKAQAGKASAAQKALKKQQALNGNSTCVERPLNVTSTELRNHKPEPEPEPIKVKTLVEALPLPDFVNAQIWEMYKKHRGSKFSTNAQSLILKTLAKAKLNGHDPNTMLEQSIANGWKGVFEPKSQGANYGNERSERRRRTIEGLTGYKAGSLNATSNAIEGFAERVD